MQYKIPQNVGLEDRIVGPLTLRQLIILASGFGISYVLFAILSKLYELNIFEYIIILIPALFAAAFALIKINDIRLTKFLLLFMEFALKPKKRLWDHRGIAGIVAPDLEGVKKEKKEQETAEEEAKKTRKATNLRELSQVLDSGGFEHVEGAEHKKIDEADDDDLVAEAYFGHKDSSTGNMYWRTKDSHKKMLDLFAKLPITKVKKGTKEAELMKQKIADVKQETEAMKQQQTPEKKPAQSQAIQASQPAKKKKRPRKRKRKTPQPVRNNNQVNTTREKQPAEYLSKTGPPRKNPPKKDNPGNRKNKINKNKKNGEFEFKELEKGEIEINLDD